MVRHAHARAARVRFSLSGTFEVEITDDGVGLGTRPKTLNQAMKPLAAFLGQSDERSSADCDTGRN